MAVITGTISLDRLTGTALADQIGGLAGNDILSGLAGNDTLDGGAGNDTMIGGAGDDTYIVDSISDKIVEKTGEGIDLVKAGISFTLGDFIENLLLTGTGAISGTGNALANTLTGNGAANTLKGLAGNDILSGGAGNDMLVGGTGMDTMTGGLGIDKFVFDDGDFSSKTSTGADTIVDFAPGDKIDLSLVDAVSTATHYNQPGDQSFVFINHNRFHIQTGRELRYDVVGGNTYVYGSTNGDSTADFCIKLSGVHTLSASDFVL
ncbi:MAG: calcium-binding protein [Novosphingobium sp.]